MTEDELRARVDRLETALSSIAYMSDDAVDGNRLMEQVRQSMRITLRDYLRLHPTPVSNA